MPPPYRKTVKRFAVIQGGAQPPSSFLAELSIEAFEVAVVNRLAWFDEGSCTRWRPIYRMPSRARA
jgi:hypothetical protein